MKKLLSILTLLLITLQGFAQDSGVEMADALRSSGKIYVVVAVMALIFIGIVVYLFTIDRRLSKIEKQNQH
jgi:CcmD family protein